MFWGKKYKLDIKRNLIFIILFSPSKKHYNWEKKLFNWFFKDMYTPVKKFIPADFLCLGSGLAEGRTPPLWEKILRKQKKSIKSNQVFSERPTPPPPALAESETQCLGFISFWLDPRSVLKATSLFLQFLVDILPLGFIYVNPNIFGQEAKMLRGS